MPRAAYGAIPQLAKHSSASDAPKSSVGNPGSDPLELERLAYIKAEILNRASSIGGAENDAYTLYHSMKTAQETIKTKNQAIRDLNTKINSLQSQLDSLRQKIEKEHSHYIISLESLLPAPVLSSLSPNASKNDLIIAVKKYINDLRHKSVLCFDETQASNDDYTFRFDEGNLNNEAAPFAPRSPTRGVDVSIFAASSALNASGPMPPAPSLRDIALASVPPSQRSVGGSSTATARTGVDSRSENILRTVIAERDAALAENAVLKAKISGLYKQKRLSNIALHEYTESR
jgi:hypothetical protein